MTGFDSKRKMALAKLPDDDDTQVYADTLLIVYQRGFADGKAAQRKPLTNKDLQKLADKHLFYQPEGYEVSGIYNLARAIEAAHGIKEQS
jgi:hypothetical protein